ncbi:MAG TPA: sigma 54-interacting transcriptional regulator [Kofleriaceae bacterium]|nr:sigma 54-interacting transcriptional regulator [Kofleriaceae bacterium]
MESAAIRSNDYLLVIEGERSWTVRLPAAGELIIGRGSEAGLNLSDALVSRRHAQLLIGPDGLRISDLGSRHGTLVSGETLASPRMVRSGDVITIGSSLIVVQRPLRPAAARHVLDLTAYARRLDEETERAVFYQRELAVVVLRSAAPFDIQRAEVVLDGRLRLMDSAALLDDHHVAFLLPELENDEAVQTAMELAPAIAPAGKRLACGIAVSPADGVDGDTLLASARAAADAATPGAVLLARDAVQEIEAGPHRIVIADPGMAQLYDLARRLARSDMPILIQGETGAGKELAAAAIHSFSPRSQGPFASINGAAIPESLAESEIFGHARGAFSGAMVAKPGQFENADGGTLFLDEIGELPSPIQAKLLRVLESGEMTRVGETKPRTIDVRVVAATNRDLERDVATGRFRRDLFFRLGAARLELPPLRDRPRDIAVLARSMLADTCARLGRETLAMSVAATQALFLHDWPGNVRELKNALAYAAAAAPDSADEIESWHLPPQLAQVSRRASDAGLGPVFRRTSGPRQVLETLPESMGLDAVLVAANPEAEPPAALSSSFRPIADEVRDLERIRMIDALRATGGVQNRAAERIGMPGRTFATKLKRYRITPDDWAG